MDVLFKGGLVFTGKTVDKVDLLIQNGKITDIGPDISGDFGNARVVQVDGCLISPGFTDLHTHLRQPGFEAKETIKTGTMAAAAGGFTTVCTMPNLNPVPDELHHLEIQRAIIDSDAEIRVLPYGAITMAQKGVCLSDIELLAPFVAGFTDDGVGVDEEDIMQTAMDLASQAGSMIAAHCECRELLPMGGVCVQEDSWFAKKKNFIGFSSKSEWAEIERDIKLSEITGCPLHICHLSTQKGFELVKAAKEKGIKVTCEVTPHNLLLSCDDIEADDGRFKMNPPLRTSKDVSAALAAALDGTIDAIATDHAPHTEQEKSGGFENSMNGVVGLETAFPVLYTKLVGSGKISLEKLLYLLTKGPRSVLGEKPNQIKKGEVADITVIDLEVLRAVDPDLFYTKGRSTPFDGWRLKGWPIMTVYNGEIVWEGLYRRFLDQVEED